MADPFDRNPDNVPGPFFVDNTCIDCDMCRGTAPKFFVRNDEAARTYVRIQPITAEDIALAQEALEECPTDSIGRE